MLYKKELLDLSANQLIRLEPLSFSGLNSLQQLVLSKNLLKRLLPDTFAGLNQLKWLDLSNNRLFAMAEHVFDDVPALQSLDLSKNNFTTFSPDTFVSMTALTHLDLSSNSLVSPSFTGLSNLQYLNISNNLLHQVIPTNYRTLNSLIELDLSYNRMMELSTSSFDGLYSLQILQITHQPYLHSIKLNAFSGLANLRILNLSSCDVLEKIDENAFEYDDKIEVLDMSNCRLKRIPSKLVQWTRLKSLNLSGNPLHCDCEMLSFLPKLLEKLSINATCYTPPWLFNKNIIQLSQTCASMNESQLSIAIVGASLLALTILLLIGICIYQHFRPCNRFSAAKYRNQQRYRAHLYSKPFLIASPINDKSDLLSEQTCYTTTNHSSLNGVSRSVGAYDEEGYYSSVTLPAESKTYERTRMLYPMPPPATTIPQTLPKHCVDDNFRIISEYPVPITEL
ncbi:unnamed protein product [Thelazia callipaeda]|uniref:LRRCT domain-containing protein n=1 Tax=Thelazia callipaeda TaxID=103827 RepID=A0A0N5DBL1_THECL|nr:unnamed protein product [Thelazia callipaeda]